MSEGFLGRLSKKIVNLQLRRIISSPGPRVWIVYPPSMLCEVALENLKKGDLLIADLVDDQIARMPSIFMKEQYLRCYKKVLPICDWIISTGESLKNYEKVAQQKIEVLTNGVSIQNFNQALFERPNRKRSRVGYVGSINSTMDIELMLYILKKLPKVRFDFAGFTDGIGSKYLKKLLKYPNFRYLGAIHFSKVPEFLRTCDIMISPKKPGISVVGNDSLKIYQYLAAGKAVVTTSVNPAIKFSDVLQVADEPEDFANALMLSLQEEESSEIIQKRLNAVRNHDWRYKIEYFENKIIGILKTRSLLSQ